jgi:putative FmdB family regulatory protein
MPIYEYQCAACGGVTEKWQKISEEPLAVCPACGGGLSKLISSCSFHLKGSGWYVTDYGGNRSGASVSDKCSESSASTETPGSDNGGPPKEAATTEASPPKFK